MNWWNLLKGLKTIPGLKSGKSKGVSGGKVLGVTVVSSKISKWLYEAATVTIEFGSSFYHLDSLLETLDAAAVPLTYSALNVTRYGNVQAGVGKFWSKFMGHWVYVQRPSKDDGGLAGRVLVTFFFVSKAEVIKLIESFAKQREKRNEIIKRTGIYRATKPGTSDISYDKSIPHRTRESIFIDPDTMAKVERRIDNFLEKKAWFEKRGIPYKYALLLHGVPGTGKSSIAKYIAAKTNRDIVISSPAAISSLVSALHGRLCLLEDIDCSRMTATRAEMDGDSDEMFGLGDYMPGGNLSDLLNALDGVGSVEDCIIVATTNHLDKLDDALIRKGRFDDVIEVAPLQAPEIHRMVEVFLEQPVKGLRKKMQPTAGAVVQDIIVNYYDQGPEAVVAAINRELGEKEKPTRE